jgi:hypothetical protein
MGRLRFGLSASIVVTIFLSLFLPACGGHKPPGASPLPLRITLNPATSFSLQVGATIQLTATAVNAGNSAITPTFIFTSSNPGIVDVAPNGAACAGSWNAPLYSICTPARTGTASVTATALGATSPPTLFFVHPPIDNIVVSVVPPVNSPPPACPTQQSLPIACDLPFNRNAANFCLSQNQVQTLQARAYGQGVEITGSVGPFTWTEVNSAVTTITPILTTSDNVATNQATAVPGVPGQTQVIATASGVSSQPYYFETCPVQCIDLEVGVNGTQATGTTNFVVAKGTSETITATAVDVQGCTVPKPPLTWVSSSPAALEAGGTTGCGPGTTCAITTTLAGAAAITASCSPPTCNIGFPLNPAALQPPYIPQPVYPVSAISGLVTPAASSSGSGSSATSTSVLVTSQDCVSDAQCEVGIYNVATSTNLPGRPSQLPAPPNSLIFDPAGDRAYMGSEFGAVAITPANIGGTTSPFTSLPAPSTPLGLVTGKVIGVSQNGSAAIFSDTVSTPNQVYVVNVSSSSAAITVALNINNATAATFSPDGLKAFILGNGGNSLYIYSSLQALQAPVSLATPATAITFNSTGSFALLSGGGAVGTFAAYNTCDNSAVPALVAGTVPSPPIFLKVVPAGNVPLGNTTIFGNPPVTLEPTGLDIFFGVDNTGIDVIATSSSQPVPVGSSSLAPLCPQGVTLAQIQTTPPVTPPTLFPPIHIPIGQGTFHPINFFLSPDTTKAYIVANDRSSILVYNFATNATSGISLVNNANPVAADITPDGTLIYVAGTDGLLHQLNTILALDQNQVSFQPLANSTNSFCFTGTNCQMNIVAVRP